MKFLESELICLNSLIDGQSIVGIEIKENNNMIKEQYITEAISGLKGKKIIDGNDQLTKLGILPIKTLEDYKKSEKHISINSLRIALLDNNEVIAIDCIDNSYDISRYHKLNIIISILDKSKFMRKASDKNKRYEAKEITMKDLILEENNLEKECIRITKYYVGSVVDDNLYYWDDENGFQYSLISKKRLQLEPNIMRIKLLNSLDINY